MRFTFDIVGVTRSQVNAQQFQLQPIDLDRSGFIFHVGALRLERSAGCH